MRELVSIIVPLYNCEKYIKRCISSILLQTYDNIEIIVVDDGSIDKGAQIVKSIQKKQGAIKYFYQENSGPGVARNKAIEKAEGKYLLFVDSDDYISSDYIEKLVDVAEKKAAELVIAGYTITYFDKRKKEKEVLPRKYEQHINEEWAYRISACCSRLYLKEFWDKNTLRFNEDREARAEDVPIVLYTNATAKNVAIANTSGYFYFQHANSAMNNRTKDVLFGFPYDAFKDVYEKLRVLKIENSRDFLNFGILKFLAQFDLVIYRKANLKEKQYFKRYLKEVCGKEFKSMIGSWKKLRWNIDLPIVHKLAIEMFILKNYRVFVDGEI